MIIEDVFPSETEILTMDEKIKVGISSCLLGEKVRYDAGHKLDRFITDTLGRYFEWVPVCPEFEYGLPVPREALRLIGTPEAPRLGTNKAGIYQTEGMLRWAKKKLAELEQENLCGFIFKSKSPSSGIGGVKVYTPSGMPSRKGVGIFGRAFINHFPHLPVEDDGHIHNPGLRENFIESVFVFKRWQEFKKRGGFGADLIGFHTDHKLQILAHSPRHYTILGRLVAKAKKSRQGEILSEYIMTLMSGIHLIATVKKNTNVLLHIIGYFKKHASSDEKEELLEVIDNYRKGIIPLIVPITLIKHYVRKFDVSYLKRQYYLNPHPLEVMLRNHV